MVENNSTVGVVVYHTDADFAFNTIRYNGLAGLWLYDSPANNFSRNLITGNATEDINREGIEVVGGSDVVLMQEQQPNYYYYGYNKIANNDGNQISVDYASYLYMGKYANQELGVNSIIGPDGLKLTNSSSTTVEAEGNWWGTDTPYQSFFTGPVDWQYYMSNGDPVSYAGVPSGFYPSEMAPQTIEKVLQNGSSIPAKQHLQDNTKEKNEIVVSSETTSRAIRRKRMKELRDSISSNPTDIKTLHRIRELYQLHLLALSDTSFATEIQNDRLTWSQLINRYLLFRSGKLTSNITQHLSSESVQQLMVMEVHEALCMNRYSVAKNKLDNYASDITDSRYKIPLMIYKITLLDKEGSYQKAINILDHSCPKRFAIYELYAFLTV